MSKNTRNTTDIALHANMILLQERFEKMAKMASEAGTAMAGGNKNLAIGSLIGLDEQIQEVDAIYKAITLMNRIGG